jgi:peptidoglycan/LPS O-acetylase OafA/YrhL
LGTGVPVKLSIGDVAVDLTWILATGSNGVSVFFVLSGFLLYRHWLETTATVSPFASAAKFYLRRVLRILPAFAFFTAVYLALVALFGKHPSGAPLTSLNFLLNITFLSPLVAWFGGTAVSSLDIVPGTWSLNAEVWFYILMPALAAILVPLPARWIWLLALSLVAPLYRASLGAEPPFLLRFILPGVVDAFLFGMVVADLSARGWIGKFAGLGFPFGAVWYVGTCAGVSPFPIDWATQIPAASALMIVGLVAPGDWPWQRWFSGRTIVSIGRISYSMFLSNVLVAWYIVLPIWRACGLESSGSLLLMNFLLGYPVLHLISMAGFRWIEAPFLGRNPTSPRAVILPALAIGVAVLAVSLLPPLFVALARGDISMEEVARRLSRSPPVWQPLHIVGRPVVNSETGNSALVVEQPTPNQIRMFYPGGDTGNRWIAVVLPVDPTALVGGRTLSLTANLSTTLASNMEGCLGIYNGREDACTKVTMRDSGSFSVETRMAQNGSAHFHFSFFPRPNAGPFEATLSDITVQQERR